MTAQSFISQYPDGNLPVLDLAKFIGVQPSGMRRKAERMNGLVNYHRDEDTLTIEQLKVFLPTYIEGSRPLQGDKKRAVVSLLSEVGIKINAPDNTPKKTVPRSDKGIIKGSDISMSKDEERPDKRFSNLSFNRVLVFVIAVACIGFQASHFAFIEMQESPLEGRVKIVTAWGIAIAFESLVLLLTALSDLKSWLTWFWLALFFVIAFFMNLTFYSVIEAADARKVILSVALPFSILALTHLYLTIRNNNS